MMLKAENISKKFGKNGLASVSMSISEKQFLCITGESGCGKTTLLNILSGMLMPDTGTVTLDGKNIYLDMKEQERTFLRNQVIGYMIQGNSLIPELTVWQNAVCPLELYGRKKKDSDIIQLFQQLGIDNVMDSFPSEISGGEYRRALLARVLLLDAKIIIADEPTSNLDENSAVIVRQMLYEAYQNGKGLLIVTHDKAFSEYHPEILELHSGGEI